MVKTCFFDLETEHLIQEFETGRGSMDFRETQARRLKIIPKLNMAVACIISYENQSTMLYYEKGQESELINKLNEFDRIIGHNLFGFDYLVLSPHTKGNIQKELQQKTYDTFLALKDASGGMWLGLDELCKLNLGTSKTLNPLDVPKLWRSGEKEKVKEYCCNDVLMLKKLFLHGKTKGVLKYPVKDHGKTIAIRQLKVPWMDLDM